MHYEIKSLKCTKRKNDFTIFLICYLTYVVFSFTHFYCRKSYAYFLWPLNLKWWINFLISIYCLISALTLNANDVGQFDFAGKVWVLWIGSTRISEVFICFFYFWWIIWKMYSILFLWLQLDLENDVKPFVENLHTMLDNRPAKKKFLGDKIYEAVFKVNFVHWFFNFLYYMNNKNIIYVKVVTIQVWSWTT